MSDLRKAAQQALEALESGPDGDPILAGETITALRAALAQPEQEPVTWQYDYTRLPQRKPLTDQEAKVLWTDVYEPGHHVWVVAERFARAIERAHGIGGEA